jgi:signal transduction histidine kinase
MRSDRAVLPPALAAEEAFAQSLERVPKSAAAARELLVAALQTWHLVQLADTAALVLGELVSNAVRHAEGEVMRVSVIRRDDGHVRVSVIDRSRTRPKARPATADADSGRGLVLITALSAAWASISSPAVRACGLT